eukprot:TRINITY_DN49819_c0_g1_i1.p1 TRINITY_DN49819_c0_g1~~TRINITY_DN49819_c0_g1_i1.p1  ORF type:complete len:315 (-),score=42.96 TRINITY_DN49819_c0_g1_i1:91-1035(-)
MSLSQFAEICKSHVDAVRRGRRKFTQLMGGRTSRRQSSAWRCRCAASVLPLFASLPQVLGHLRAVVIRGDATGEPATLKFGPDSAATSLRSTSDGKTLQFLSGDAVIASVSPTAAILPQTSLDGEVVLGVNPEVAGARQWALWDLQTFDDAGGFIAGVNGGPGDNALGGPEWSLNDRSFCGSPHDQFLGGHCRFASSETTRKYTTLPEHTRVRVRARVHFFDEWEGDSVALSADGRVVWSQSHDWCPGFLKWKCSKYGVDTCGRSTPDRLSVHAEAILHHTSDVLTLSFASSLPGNTDACATSWGVDDVSLELL